MDSTPSAHVPGPDRFRDIARTALSLAGDIRNAHAALRTSDVEFVRHVGFRLVQAAGQTTSIAGELEEAARDLDRYLSRPADACEIPWGVCPDHGNTLVSSGSQSTCGKCYQTWDYDRITLPCEEPARWLLADAEGATSRVCDGHATDAQARIDHATLTPLSSGKGGIS